MAKHFLKTLTIFILMIIFGLLGVLVVEYLKTTEAIQTGATAGTEVAN